MSYSDGYLLPVPRQNRQACQAMAKPAAGVFLHHSATRTGEFNTLLHREV